MSNTKFTKGPWAIHKQAYCCVTTESGQTLANCGSACRNYGDIDLFRAEQLANTNLIAAAPELYDALDSHEQPLRVAINILHRMGSAAASEVADELREALGASCSALAKARGEL